MPTSRKQSGFLIEGTSGTPGHFEVVVPSPVGGLTHYWRNNSVAGLPWNGPNCFAHGAWGSASLLQTNFGITDLEVVARQGDQLGHFWRMGGSWHGPSFFGSGLAGNPAFIQSNFGRTGNFEIVVPRSGGGLAHFSRDNDTLFTSPWSGPTNFGTGNIEGVSMIQGNFGDNFEVVARQGNQLVFYFRDGGGWHGPFVIASGIAGTPSLIQSGFGGVGNFEVVVPRLGGGLSHFWRNNDDPSLPWIGPINFGSGAISEVSLIQSSFGPGNLEVIAREGNRLALYWRTNGPPWTWNGPFYVAEETIRLHIKILSDPIFFTIDEMLAGMRQVYETAGIRVDVVSTERLSLPALEDVDVSGCWEFIGIGLTGEQHTLFTNRNNVADAEVVVYFVRTTVPSLNGCAAHPRGAPGAIVTSIASQWTLGHEIGHILGLGHVNNNDRLMTGNSTDNITNEPPDFDAGEVNFMRGHSLTR